MHRLKLLAPVAVWAILTNCSGSPDTTAVPAAQIPASDRSPATTPSVASGQPERFVYGDDPNEFGFLSRPESYDDGKSPVVVLVHGGFWRAQFGYDLMEPLAADLVERGYAVWNIEYGRVGQANGGFPGTLAHVAAAIDYLAVLGQSQPLDIEQVAVVGHSAGGHLAAWVGGRDALPPGVVGASPIVIPKVVIGQGAVVDLIAGANDGLGAGAVTDFIGGSPGDFPDRYEVAQPRNGAAVAIMVSGTADGIVPLQYSSAPGYEAESIVVEGADHFDLIDPGSEVWKRLVAALATVVPPDPLL